MRELLNGGVCYCVSERFSGITKEAGDSLKIKRISQEKWKESRAVGWIGGGSSLAVPLAWGWHEEAEED